MVNLEHIYIYCNTHKGPKNPQNFLENGISLTIVANGFRGETWYYIQLLQSMEIPFYWRWGIENPTIIWGVIRKIRLIIIQKLFYALYYTVGLVWFFLGFFFNKSKSIKSFSIIFLRMLPLPYPTGISFCLV